MRADRHRAGARRRRGGQIQYLKGISVIYSIYIYVLLGMVVLTAIYMSVRRYRAAKDPHENVEMVTFD